MRGAKAHYIESATRLTSPSLTGKLLHAVPGIRLYTQYEDQAHGKWHYGGWVYDRFTTVKRDDTRAHPARGRDARDRATFPFRRLLDALAPLLRPGGLVEQAQGSPVETLWQTGGTPVEGLDLDVQPFVPTAELEAAIARGRRRDRPRRRGNRALRDHRRPAPDPRHAAIPTAASSWTATRRASRDLLHERGIAMHCEPETLSVDDLVEAASYRIESASSPTPFQLVK